MTELAYPPTRTVDAADVLHGETIPDPYRWLEDETSPETAAWVEAQNAITFPYLERIPYGYTCHFARPDWKLPRRNAA